MPINDVAKRADIDDIVRRFYEAMLKDPIIGFIFTDVATIHLESHLPIIGDFWEDRVFGTQHYQGNTLQKHLDIHAQMPLKEGHFTRWLYLFKQAVLEKHEGAKATKMLDTADRIGKAIAASLNNRKRAGLRLTLDD